MAKLIKGLLGGFSGSLHGITGYKRNNAFIIQKKCDRSKVVYSESQKANWFGKLFSCTFFESIYMPRIFNVLFPLSESDRTLKHACVLNKDSFNISGFIKDSPLYLSSGVLINCRVTSFFMAGYTSLAALNFSGYIGGASQSPYFTVNLLIYNLSLNDWYLLETQPAVSSRHLNFTRPVLWLQGHQIMYSYWVVSNLSVNIASPNIVAYHVIT